MVLKIQEINWGFLDFCPNKKIQTQYSKSLIAKAPSQAHLQGTQCRDTKANLAKEPALCQRTGNTLRLDRDPHCR